MPRQLTIWDVRGMDERSYSELGDPLSIRQLADSIGRDDDPLAPAGRQESGCWRDSLTAELEDAMWQFLLHAWALFGEQGAAILTVHLCSRSPDAHHPVWFIDLCTEHREVLEETFARDRDYETQTDYSEGSDDE